MYYARGGRVAQFESAEAVFPSALHFSGEGDLFPVSIQYEDDDVEAFAKGGLAHEALAVKDAGRHGDTEIVHMNKEELEELKQMWGEPTINPQTGQPEYFLKKLWKGVKKVLKPIAPILPMAAMFIPGVGPLAAAGIGALSGGVTGGWKGALAGGLTGGLTGGANPLAGQALKGLAPGLSSRAASALGSGLVGAGTGAITGQDPLKAGLMAGGMNYLADPTGRLKIPSTEDTLKALPYGSGSTIPSGSMDVLPSAMPAPSLADSIPKDLLYQAGRPLIPETTGALNTPTAAASSIPTYDPAEYSSFTPVAPAASAATPAAGGGIGGWLKNDSLLRGVVKGVPNYVPAGVAALAAAAALSSKKKGPGLEAPGQFFGRDWGAGMGGTAPTPLGTSLGVQRQRNTRPMEDYYNAGFMPQFRYLNDGYAHGGDVEGHNEGGERQTRSFAVNGAGTGRSDEIPAMLSDGEYVIDAETVAMLGDGSSKAGAKKLDAFRVKVRKHKGRDLAKGKFSAKAKMPEAYMAGGRA